MKNQNMYKISLENEFKNLPLLLQKLKGSLKFQKELIKEIEEKLNAIANEEVNVDPFLEKILDTTNIIIKELGICFAHYFINNENIKLFLISIYYNKILTNKILLLFKTCLNVFKSINSNEQINMIRNDLNALLIIEEENEIIITKGKEDEKIYENIYAILKELNELNQIGMDMEYFTELEKKYLNIQKEIKILQLKLYYQQNQAEIDFFHELMQEVEINLKQVSSKKPIENKFYNINEIVENKKEEEIINLPLDKRTFFYYDEKIKERPNEFIEFKNFSNPLANENRDEIKRQICSFLNTQGGRLYIGINDKNKVKGLVLNYELRDKSRRDLDSLTNDFYPDCRIDKIYIDFIPVKDAKTKEYLKSRFIMKIRVFPGDPSVLYSMSIRGYHSTIRKNNQCITLNSTEIYNQIIIRDKNKKNNTFKKEENIRDPEPERYNDDGDNDIENVPIFGINLDLNKNISDKIRKQLKEKGRPKKKKNIILREGTFAVKVTNIDENEPLNEVNKFFNGCKCYSQKMLNGHGFLNFSNLNDAIKCIENYNGNIK